MIFQFSDAKILRKNQDLVQKEKRVVIGVSFVAWAEIFARFAKLGWPSAWLLNGTNLQRFERFVNNPELKIKDIGQQSRGKEIQVIFFSYQT